MPYPLFAAYLLAGIAFIAGSAFILREMIKNGDWGFAFTTATLILALVALNILGWTMLATHRF